MAWVKLDDQFFTHPKVLDRTKDAKLLYMACLTYAAANLTDGYVSPAALRLSAAMVDVEMSVAAELVRCGLWIQMSSGYQINDYLEYNPSSEDVKQQRAENARRQAEWRERNKTNTVINEASNESRNTASNGVTPNVTNDPPVPLPVPRLTPENEKESPKSDAASATRTVSEVFSVDSDEYQTALFLQRLIRENNPKAKKATERQLQAWANDVRLMRERDERELDDIRAVISWSQHDPFWLKNILSMGKFREKFDQLMVAMCAPSRASPNGVHRGQDEAAYRPLPDYDD
jgi:hypothetical protein